MKSGKSLADVGIKSINKKLSQNLVAFKVFLNNIQKN